MHAIGQLLVILLHPCLHQAPSPQYSALCFVACLLSRVYLWGGRTDSDTMAPAAIVWEQMLLLAVSLGLGEKGLMLGRPDCWTHLLQQGVDLDDAAQGQEIAASLQADAHDAHPLNTTLRSVYTTSPGNSPGARLHATSKPPLAATLPGTAHGQGPASLPHDAPAVASTSSAAPESGLNQQPQEKQEPAAPVVVDDGRAASGRLAGTSSSGGRAGSPPAFADPHVVAAAATRALLAERSRVKSPGHVVFCCEACALSCLAFLHMHLSACHTGKALADIDLPI